MSKLDELIAELCPDGVEYLPLVELADIGTGSSNTNEEVENGKYSNIALNEYFKQNDLNKKEKGFITELFYGVILNIMTTRTK